MSFSKNKDYNNTFTPQTNEFMKNVFTCVFIFLFFLQRHSFAQYPQMKPFKNNPALSAEDGSFKDSISNYLLYKMQEPVLSNYYLNKEVYRFTLEPSLMCALFVIRLEKWGDSISITTKEASFEPEDVMTYASHPTVRPYSNFEITTNTTNSVSLNNYHVLKTLADTLFAHPLTQDRIGNDGADWILEISTKDGYYHQKKWTPQKGDALRNIGELMIDLSSLKHKKWIKKL